VSSIGVLNFLACWNTSAPKSSIQSGERKAQELERMFLPPTLRAFAQVGQLHQRPGNCSPADVPRN
jgi:hypothetical protein